MNFIRKLLCVVALSLFAASASAQSGYTRHDTTNRRVIVFVHGVLGDAVETWTNSLSKAYWPALLTKDKIFDGTNIFVAEYPSPTLGVAPSIDELAEQLRLELESNGVLTHTEIVFIAHSMGGLVTRAYLEKYRGTAAKVRLLYFLATPTTGASVASLARLVSQNPQFGKMMPMTSDGYLADLQRTWLAAPELANLPSFCAYEGQPMFGRRIVDQQSATNLCNRRLDPINLNHSDISKPRDSNDVPYLAFKSAYTTLPVDGNNLLRFEVKMFIR